MLAARATASPSGQISPAQRAGRHDTPGVQGEQSEQNPQLTAADVDRVPGLVPHLKRASSPIRSAFGICRR
ncbi:MAG: hypothetical protein WBF34_40655 [Streptosporangiaceae bacterium]